MRSLVKADVFWQGSRRLWTHCFAWQAQTGSICWSNLLCLSAFGQFCMFFFHVAFWWPSAWQLTHSKHSPATTRRLRGTSQRWALPLTVLLMTFGFLVFKSRNGRRTTDDLKCTIKPGRNRRKLVLLTATSNIKYREEIFENHQYSKRKSVYISKNIKNVRDVIIFFLWSVVINVSVE